MATDLKHRNWWVKLPGRGAFSMGGEAMTQPEALAWAKGIWPFDDLTVEPVMPKEAANAGTTKG